MLLDSLPAGTVRWNHKVTAVRTLDDGRHQVDFADGTTAVADLLIGADGAWSRVRPLLSTATPQYFGVSAVETFLFDAPTRHPAPPGRGRRITVRARPRHGLLAHREGDGTLHTYAQLRGPWTGSNGLDSPTPPPRRRVAQEFSGWAPELTALITDSDTPPVLRPIFTLPTGHRWDRMAG
ncbi:hypothetical protein GCM10023238_01740 [Streptomyces heliomycini]